MNSLCKREQYNDALKRLLVTLASALKVHPVVQALELRKVETKTWKSSETITWKMESRHAQKGRCKLNFSSPPQRLHYSSPPQRLHLWKCADSPSVQQCTSHWSRLALHEQSKFSNRRNIDSCAWSWSWPKAIWAFTDAVDVETISATCSLFLQLNSADDTSHDVNLRLSNGGNWSWLLQSSESGSLSPLTSRDTNMHLPCWSVCLLYCCALQYCEAKQTPDPYSSLHGAFASTHPASCASSNIPSINNVFKQYIALPHSNQSFVCHVLRF